MNAVQTVCSRPRVPTLELVASGIPTQELGAFVVPTPELVAFVIPTLQLGHLSFLQ